MVYRILFGGDNIPFNPDDLIIRLGRIYGIFKKNGSVKIHNRIYEQMIYNFMIAKSIRQNVANTFSGHFLLEDNALDLKAILLKFQQFMKEQYSTKNVKFVEHHGRLLFLSFLTPILNGQGHAFKEVQTSVEKRLDVVVTYFQHRYIIENEALVWAESP